MTAVPGAAHGGTSAWFASRVVEYAPAPGQLVNNPQYNDPSRALGPPVGGGTLTPDLSKLVTLGGFGGSITLAFGERVPNLPPSAANPHGLDAIVFGNAFWVGGDPGVRFAEAAVIEVALDLNGDGLPDGPWYVIRGSHLAGVPAARRVTQVYDTNTADPAHPPANPAWVPTGRSGVWSVTAYQLPREVFAGHVLANPNGAGAAEEGVFGYGDVTPTLVLGDLTGDNEVDDAAAAPEWFYTVPDDPFIVGITPGSGGGDAFDIGWAVHPETGEPADLPGFDFIRITTAVAFDRLHPLLGEVSAEVGGVARVRVRARSDFNGDGVVNTGDITAFLSAWFAARAGGPAGGADFDGDGAVTTADITAFLSAWFQDRAG